MRRLLPVMFLLLTAPLAASAGIGVYSDADVELAERTTLRVGQHVFRLASDSLAGRQNDSAGSAAAQRYLTIMLGRMAEGIHSDQTGMAAFRQPFVSGGFAGTNLLAIVRGRELPDEYVVVGGHYDHLGRAGERGCRRIPSRSDVCNGATDNAAGSAIVLAVGRALRELPVPPRRSVVLALWDTEEDGLRGSRWYVEHPIVPLEKTVAYLNFDLQGANLLPSLNRTTFAVGAETGGETLRQMVREASASSTVETMLVSYIFGELRSDYVNFVEHGVPTVFFGDSTGPCYHSTGDDVHAVDFRKLREQAKTAVRLAVAMAETDDPPAFTPPLSPLATFEDALAVQQVVRRGVSDLELFPPEQQAVLTRIRDEMDAIVAAGSENFEMSIGATLVNASDAIGSLEALECSRFTTQHGAVVKSRIGIPYFRINRRRAAPAG